MRNYRCAAGEIDLICSDHDTIVFVEVKCRTSDHAQDLQEALRIPQMRRIENAARYFLMEPCRFDVVTVLWPHHGAPQIEHFQDVFQPCRS